MNDTKYKVLLYSDGSYQAFSAAVYTAMLLEQTPNMQLTIMQILETNDVSPEIGYSWKELRPKFKRYYWACSIGTKYSWIDTWPSNPNSEWMKRVLDKYDEETKNHYDEILKKTNEIFSVKGLQVDHELICSNPRINESPNMSETVNVIVDFATKNSYDLIIMGSRGISTLNGFIFGCLAHKVLDKSPIPVMLIKKLPQEFIDNYLVS